MILILKLEDEYSYRLRSILIYTKFVIHNSYFRDLHLLLALVLETHHIL